MVLIDKLDLQSVSLQDEEYEAAAAGFEGSKGAEGADHALDFLNGSGKFASGGGRGLHSSTFRLIISA